MDARVGTRYVWAMEKVRPVLACVLLSALLILSLATGSLRVAPTTVDLAVAPAVAMPICADCPLEANGALISGMCEKPCTQSSASLPALAVSDRSAAPPRHDPPSVTRLPDGWRGPPDPFPPKSAA